MLCWMLTCSSEIVGAPLISSNTFYWILSRLRILLKILFQLFVESDSLVANKVDAELLNNCFAHKECTEYTFNNVEDLQSTKNRLRLLDAEPISTWS